MNAALQQVAAILPQTNGLDPVDHLLIGPHQHILSKRERNCSDACCCGMSRNVSVQCHYQQTEVS